MDVYALTDHQIPRRPARRRVNARPPTAELRRHYLPGAAVAPPARRPLWAVAESDLPVGRAPTTTPRQLGTLDAPLGNASAGARLIQASGALGRRRRWHEFLSRDLEVDRLEQHVEARPCLRVRERHPVAEGEEPDALGDARVEARSGLWYSRSEEPAIEPAIDRERHPGDVAGRVARQEHDRAGELLRCPVPAQWHGQRHPPEGVVQ
jgi:hypothetical protein